MRPCALDGCSLPRHQRARFCARHERRFRRTGDPQAVTCSGCGDPVVVGAGPSARTVYCEACYVARAAGRRSRTDASPPWGPARRRWKKRTPTGRLCAACGTSDEEASWGSDDRYCGTCARRGTQNGFCAVCGEARRRGRPRAGRRGRRRLRCACLPPAVRRAGLEALGFGALRAPQIALGRALWELARAGSETRLEVRVRDLATTLGITERHMWRRWPATVAFVIRFDTTATRSRGVLAFDRATIARIMEDLA